MLWVGAGVEQVTGAAATLLLEAQFAEWRSPHNYCMQQATLRSADDYVTQSNRRTMDFLSDRLDKALFHDPDELSFIEANIGFGKLTLAQARKGLRKARKAEDVEGVDLSGVIDELEQILDDLKFTKDPKSAIISWVHEHYRELEATVREHYVIEDLMIRAHSDRGYLVIAGKAAAPVTGIEHLVERLSGFRAKNMVAVKR